MPRVASLRPDRPGLPQSPDSLVRNRWTMWAGTSGRFHRNTHPTHKLIGNVSNTPVGKIRHCSWFMQGMCGPGRQRH